MDFGLGLVIGLIVGILLNWVLDPLWNPRKAASDDEKESLSDFDGLELPVETQEGLSDSVKTITQIIIKDHDDLLRIKGIGPVFGGRLAQEGIDTFQELANTSPARLRQIAETEDWQAVDVNSWIDQARQLAVDSPRSVG